MDDSRYRLALNVFCCCFRDSTLIYMVLKPYKCKMSEIQTSIDFRHSLTVRLKSLGFLTHVAFAVCYTARLAEILSLAAICFAPFFLKMFDHPVISFIYYYASYF